MTLQVTRAPAARTPGARGTILRSARCAAAVAAAITLLAACQTGVDEPDEASPGASPSATASAPAEPGPSTPPEVTAAPADSAGPVVNGPNTITAPAPGAVVAGPSVTVTGEGTAFEATLSYQVLTTGTEEVVSQGYTNAGANGEIGPYTFTVELEPGAYTVQVWEADMSDGESELGPYRNLVEVDITVE